MTFPLALAIIEDQAAIRETLHEYLCAQPEFRCVLIAESVEEFMRRLPAAVLPPQLILSDIGLPGLTGIEGLPLILQRLPEAQVLMLSVYADAERVFEALRAGAVGYLEKSTRPTQLKEALLQVMAGGSPMSPAIARHVVRYFRPAVLPSPLTPREQQVVEAIEQGLSYKLVAARLGIQLGTVQNHIRNVYRKLEINSKGELLALTRRR